MIYTVECAYLDPAREQGWNAWYSGPKLDSLLSVPGFRASQRFRAVTPTPAPYFAIHSLRDEGVLGARYRDVGGGTFGGWDDQVGNWKRNLFTGLEMAPEVPADSCLVVCDDPAAAPEGISFHWLDIAGLDRSVSRRGIAIVDRATGERLAKGDVDRVRVFEPISPRRVSPHEPGL